ALLILWLMQVYQRRKPGAAVAGLSGVTVVSMIYLLMLGGRKEKDVLDAAVQTAEWTLLLLAGCWVLFSLACLATGVTGFVAVRLTIWSLIPVVLSEFQKAPRNVGQTVWLGRCLSRSFPVMRISGEILRVMVVIGLPFAIVSTWLNWHGLQNAEWVLRMKP